MFKIRFVFRKKRRVVRRRKPNPKSIAEYGVYKERARTLVTERLAHFNIQYGFHWNTISIRNQSSRWGSCSSKGNLNFNYRIALLSPDLADYIVVHELCHLGQMNHSKNFWDLVERALPDYDARQKKLRKVDMRKLMTKTISSDTM